MKTLLLSITLFLGVTSCQEPKFSGAETFSSPSYYANNTAIVADAVKKFQKAKSINELANYMSTTYGINNVYQIHEKLLPYLKGLKSVNGLGSTTTTKKSFMGWDGMLRSVGIANTSKTYQYVKDINVALKAAPSTENQTIVSTIKSMRNKLLNDKVIIESERSNLLLVTDIIIINYDGIVEALLNTNTVQQHDSNSRLNSFWDFIVSVIITVIVVAVAFVAIAAIAIEAGILAETYAWTAFGTWGIADVYAAAAIVGAVAGAGDAILQAYQGNCYTFRCGDDENIGLQDCGSGDCQAI